MPSKRIQVDAGTWASLDLLARDRMITSFRNSPMRRSATF